MPSRTKPQYKVNIDRELKVALYRIIDESSIPPTFNTIYNSNAKFGLYTRQKIGQVLGQLVSGGFIIKNQDANLKEMIFMTKEQYNARCNNFNK